MVFRGVSEGQAVVRGNRRRLHRFYCRRTAGHPQRRSISDSSMPNSNARVIDASREALGRHAACSHDENIRAVPIASTICARATASITRGAPSMAPCSTPRSRRGLCFELIEARQSATGWPSGAPASTMRQSAIVVRYATGGTHQAVGPGARCAPAFHCNAWRERYLARLSACSGGSAGTGCRRRLKRMIPKKACPRARPPQIGCSDLRPSKSARNSNECASRMFPTCAVTNGRTRECPSFAPYVFEKIMLNQKAESVVMTPRQVVTFGIKSCTSFRPARAHLDHFSGRAQTNSPD